MKKMYTGLLAAATALLFAVTPASAYRGEWYYETPSDWKNSVLILGGYGNGSLYLDGTSESCGPRGDSYDWMRQVLRNSNTFGDGLVNWGIQYDCGSIVRICINNNVGDIGCSSYRRAW